MRMGESYKEKGQDARKLGPDTRRSHWMHEEGAMSKDKGAWRMKEAGVKINCKQPKKLNLLSFK